MNRKFPLQSLLDLSQLRLDEATRRLGELIAGEQQAAQRVEMLVQYRGEYHARFLSAAQGGLAPEQWRNYQVFLDRLDQAIHQAQEMMAQSKQRTLVGQQDWLDKRAKGKAFGTLADRHKARVDYADRRREQKAADEHSARKHQETKEQDAD